jgi:hypothetical protein
MMVQVLVMSGIDRVRERIAQIKRDAGSHEPSAAAVAPSLCDVDQLELVAPLTEVELCSQVAAEVEKRVVPLESQIPEVIEAIMAHINALVVRIDQLQGSLSAASKRISALEACLRKRN